MPNLVKLKKRALEYEQKKQFDRALETYKQVLSALGDHVEESDVSLYNRVGDLMLRTGDIASAITHYERAVDLYTEGGFINNAIALCNKILRTSPGRTSIYYKLGRISAKKGFTTDAKQNFLEYADRMQRTGQLEEAFRALREFADLCPDQEDIRLMLAEQLVREGRNGEAIDQLQTLFTKYEAEGRAQEARATADRIRAIDPSLTPRPAASRPTPKSGDLIFIDVNYDEPARSVGAPVGANGQASQPPAPARADLSVADDADARASEMMPDVELPLLEIEVDNGPFEAPASEEIAALDGISHGASLSAGEDDAAAAITSHVDAALITGFEETSLAPEAFDDPSADASARVDGDAEQIADFAEDPATIELEPDLAVALDPELDIEVRSGKLETALEPPALEIGADAVDASFERDRVDAGDLPLLDIGADVDVDEGTASTSAPLTFIYSGEDERAPLALELPEEAALSDESDSSADLLVGGPISLDASATLVDSATVAEPPDWARHRTFAESLLESGERERGIAELEVALRGMQDDGDIRAAISVADELIRIDPSSVRHHQKQVELAVHAADRGRLIGAYRSLADCLLGSGQLDKARAVYARVLELAPDDARALEALRALAPPSAASVVAGAASSGPARAPGNGAAPAPSPSPSPPVDPAAEDGYVNLADWWREDEPVRSTRMVAEVPEVEHREQVDFAEMLSRFKEGVAANVDEADHESHYDLGLAYQEMGLLDEAIAEFQKALRGTEQRVRTYEALGRCFVEKRQYQVALTILARALGDTHQGDERLVGVLYLLGQASEALERWADARRYYERVFAVDIEFRDVRARLADLERRVQ